MAGQSKAEGRSTLTPVYKRVERRNAYSRLTRQALGAAVITPRAPGPGPHNRRTRATTPWPGSLVPPVLLSVASRSVSVRTWLGVGAAMAFAAAMLSWVALWNGYPLIFSDTQRYLNGGILRYLPSEAPIFYG